MCSACRWPRWTCRRSRRARTAASCSTTSYRRLPPLLDVARGLRPATHLADSKLRAIVMKFISTCPQVVTDVRTRFGNSGGSGAEILDHVQHFWVEHLENDENDAEQDLNDFEWTAVFSGKAR